MFVTDTEKERIQGVPGRLGGAEGRVAGDWVRAAGVMGWGGGWGFSALVGYSDRVRTRDRVR